MLFTLQRAPQTLCVARTLKCEQHACENIFWVTGDTRVADQPKAKRMNTDPQTEVCISDLDPDRFRHVVLDFDQTLFLDNSTERFLDALRPRLLAFLIVACTDWMLQLLAWFRWVNYDKQRDFVRVLACTCLMPWNHFLWPGAARRLADTRMNHALLNVLAPGRPVIVLSYGFRHIIAPILKAAGLSEATLVCSNAVPPFDNLRVAGKLKALEAVLPAAEWEHTLFITDSEDDAEVIEAIPGSRVLHWGTNPTPAFTGLYVPLRYTVEGKYPSCRYFTTQIVLEDLALLWLAYAFSWHYAAALAGLFLSLYTIYEIGYYDNDRVAVSYEAVPVVSEAAKRFVGFSKIKAWMWAFFFSVAGIFCARLHLFVRLYRGPFPFLFSLICWFALLGGLYLVFYCFNRLSPRKRILLFPLLHGFKTFAFILFVPLTLPGVLLLTAQVVSISATYWIYRLGGVWQRFNRQAWRLALFLLFAATAWCALPGGLAGTGYLRWLLILLWGSVRALEQATHKNILRFVVEGFRAGELPPSRHDAAHKKE